jgi:putative membrane protein
MEDIATRNNIIMHLEKYIEKRPFFNTKTKKQEIWLHKLPKTSFLFDIIKKLREKYKDDTFVIKQNINITNKKINKEINFSNCIFMQNVNFSGCSFNENSTFSYIKNKQGEIIANAEVNFFKANFKESVNFSGCNFNLKANFSETIFGIKKEDNNSDESSSEVKFLIENAKFQKEVNFSKAIFYDAIYFSETEFCTDIEDYAKESINFENAQFKRKVRFHHCKFYNTVRFENTSFNKLVDFYCAHFYKPQQFHFTDFLDRAIFSNTEFNEEVQFLHCKVDNSYVRFESATFKKGLDISRSNFNDKVNFWNIEIEKSGEQYIFNNPKSVKYANDFEVQDKTPTIYKQFRETYRIIKDNFYRQNNKIEGSEFYIKEMSVYQRELLKKSVYNRLKCLKDLANTPSSIKDFITKKVIITFIIIIYLFFVSTIAYKTKSVPFILTLLLTPFLLFCLFYLKDIILLLFNRFSNYFGTDWVRGVVFTMMIGSLFSFFLLVQNYNLWYINIYDINAWIQSIGFLIRIINVVDMKPFEENGNSLVKLVDNNDTNNIILFIGRIFVTYGVYQTIQAFRKFGKS